MAASDDLIKAVGTNIQEKASLIWSAADTLRGPYKPHEYGLVILPMTVIKRFHDCLAPTHEAVLAAADKYKAFAVKDGFLREASGYPFYNTSKFTFETLNADPENIEDNFKDYINGFSDNVQDILARMKFADQIERLSDPDAPLLYQIICDFCKPQADMSPDKIRAVDMGYIFENLIQRFSESYDEDAGAHFTSRDIVYLMTDLLIQADSHVFDGDRITKTVYDQTMGTSQMLGCTEERLRQLDAEARVTCYGQEFNPFTFGIAKASALIRGEDDANMRFGDTLSADKFDDFKFDYCISNPPFGDPWNPQAAAVEKEFKTAGGGRFPVEKLPAKGDGQMLFVLNGLSKLKDDGVMAIIQDASPLYKGKPGSGEDGIRRYVLENDWLDAIVQLPCDSKLLCMSTLSIRLRFQPGIVFFQEPNVHQAAGLSVAYPLESDVEGLPRFHQGNAQSLSCGAQILPRRPFDFERVAQRPEHLAGDVALEAPDGLLLGFSVALALSDVILGPLIIRHPGHCDLVKRPVGAPVAPSVQAMAFRFARARQQRGDAA